jgi:ribonuclease P protein component
MIDSSTPSDEIRSDDNSEGQCSAGHDAMESLGKRHSFSFEKSQRLLTKSDYNSVFTKAKKIVTGDFIVFYSENDLGFARLGLALSKKMLAKAHDRNRIKRLLREGFRHSALPSIDIIFLARQNLAKKDNMGLTRHLRKTWDKLNSCCDR